MSAHPSTLSSLNVRLSGLCDERRRSSLKSYLVERRIRPALTFALECDPPLLDEIVDAEAAMTGLPSPSLCPPTAPGLPTVASAVHPSILRALGLPGVELIALGAQRLAHLGLAFEAIRARFAGADDPEADYRALVEEWIAMIAWLSLRSTASSAAVFSSAAFPEFCGCVFVTDLCLRHVAPDVTFPCSSSWALQDNLIHEALHHRFESRLKLRLVYRDRAAAQGEPSVSVPWRNTRWTFGHAFHALYVYLHLVRVRNDALTRIPPADPEATSMRQALDRALSSAAELGGELRRNRATYLNAAGESLLDEVLAL